ncbi:Protein kinase domain-containing protein [Aspergillus sclerotialis]|uniref:Protein kinase domain-containing protein n=1 Tax=Aspergillus sclerotialis TaxID=2070753 RepID=A0A3A2ZSI0_9EURO|nr:Protein kinase domain-containing protein [Aspergillus sclerotialis]
MSEILLDLKSYVEYGDYLRYQTLVLRLITSSGGLKSPYRQFHQFVEAIDYNLFRENFLKDTVTEIALTLSEHSQNLFRVRDKYQTLEKPFITVASKLHCDTREDPRRITYPSLDQIPDTAKFNADQLEVKDWISPTVFKVSLGQDIFAYKRIGRPIYEPGDTKHILEEIKALAELRDEPNIAQIVGIVISENPYKTRPSAKREDIITGFLLKYYTGGPPDWGSNKILAREGKDTSRHQAAKYCTRRRKNAILVDISGSGGYEYDWLSPEMQTLIEQDDCAAPADMPLKARMHTDCWAYGKLLLAFAKQVQTTNVCKQLHFVANGLMSSSPETRIMLGEAIRVLDEAHASYIRGSS